MKQKHIRLSVLTGFSDCGKDNSMNQKTNDCIITVRRLYAALLSEVASVLDSSNCTRLRNDILVLLNRYSHTMTQFCEAPSAMDLTVSYRASSPAEKQEIRISEGDYKKIADIFRRYKKQILASVSLSLHKRTSDGSDTDCGLQNYEQLAEMFDALIFGSLCAGESFRSDLERYLAQIRDFRLSVSPDGSVNIILDDYTVDPSSTDTSAAFESSLAELGNYAADLLKVSGKKPIDRILCRVNMNDAKKILSGFGNPCFRGEPVPACYAIISLCKTYQASDSVNVIMEINNSISAVKDTCQTDCDPLKKVNAVSYFLPRPAVIGFFDPAFPEIIFVRECDYGSAEAVAGLSEGEVYDLQTAIHEYLHYCSHTSESSGLIRYSTCRDHYAETGFNEGMTEYLAIHCMDHILDAGEFAEGRSYPDQVAVAAELVKVFGLEFMISCYTDGGIQRIGSAVNALIDDPAYPHPWELMMEYMSTLQKTMSGYAENDDGTPLTWSQRQKIMKECRDNMLKILRKGKRA